jgi:hypothetical protein
MRSELILMSVTLVVSVALLLYWEHIKIKKMFEATTKRINKIYDSAKAFLFVHFVDQVSADETDIDENIN